MDDTKPADAGGVTPLLVVGNLYGRTYDVIYGRPRPMIYNAPTGIRTYQVIMGRSFDVIYGRAFPGSL